MSIITQKIESSQIKDSNSSQTEFVSSSIPQLPDSVINRIAGFTSYDELAHTSRLICKHCPKLPIHVLNLNNSQITDKELIDLINNEKESLNHINLSNCPNITSLSLEHLSKLQNLTALNLSGCIQITDAGVKDLSKLQNLTVLNLSGCNYITDTDVKELSKLQNLTALNLSGCIQITDAGVKDLSKLQNLTILNLNECKKITDLGVKDLSKLQNLTALNLSECKKITDLGVKDLSKLQNLTALNLSICRKITDVGVKDLSKLQNLTTLELNFCINITDVGLKHLSKLQNLTQLDLNECCQIKDTGVKDLSKLQNLTALNLSGCNHITDAGVEDLLNMQRLTKLKLSDAMSISTTNVKELNAIRKIFRQILIEKTALSKFINEKSKKFGIRKCTLLINNEEDAMNCEQLSTGCQITINPLYLLGERDMDSFLSQNPDDQKNVKAFLSEKRPELLDKAAKNLIEWFNSNKLYQVHMTDENELLAKELLVMHAIEKLSASKRFVLTHEMSHANDLEGGESLGDFDPSELDFIESHQFNEVRADLAAAREENAHDVAIARFEWLNIFARQLEELDPHPTDENRAKALKIDHDKILKGMAISLT